MTRRQFTSLKLLADSCGINAVFLLYKVPSYWCWAQKFCIVRRSILVFWITFLSIWSWDTALYECDIAFYYCDTALYCSDTPFLFLWQNILLLWHSALLLWHTFLLLWHSSLSWGPACPCGPGSNSRTQGRYRTQQVMPSNHECADCLADILHLHARTYFRIAVWGTCQPPWELLNCHCMSACHCAAVQWCHALSENFWRRFFPSKLKVSSSIHSTRTRALYWWLCVSCELCKISVSTIPSRQLKVFKSIDTDTTTSSIIFTTERCAHPLTARAARRNIPEVW